MSFNWNEYSKLAEELAVRTTEEACLRTAISRTYYSVYHAVRNYASEIGYVRRPDETSHRPMWDFFKRKGGKTCNAIHSNGMKLKRLREDADYETATISTSDVTIAFRGAENAIHWLNQLKGTQKLSGR